jgi:hypothetical protein
MEKAIESDIRIDNVVNPVVVDEVIISEVPVEDVQVQVSESVVIENEVDVEVDPHVGVVNVDQVQGEN